MQERVSSCFGRLIPPRRASLLAAMIAAGAMFYSAWAPALGLGDISLHSALNQPLNADIDLVDAEGLDQNDLAVGLATADDYSRAGIDRIFFLNDLRFTPVFQANRKFIHVTSVKPVTEPFLNFLVQVSRPGGQLLRDYTVLLDPAGTVQLTPASIPTNSTSQANQGSDYTRAAASPSAPPQVAPAKAKAPAERPTTTQNKRYTVEAGDTLWTIGKKLTAAGTPTPPNQLVREIHALNPGRAPLKAGQILLLPDSVVLPVVPGTAGVVDGDANQAHGGVAGALGAAPPGNTPPGNASPTNGTSGPGAVQTPEQLIATALQNQQLQQSLDDAQGRLKAEQVQSALKDKQLADLQAQLAGGKPPATPGVVSGPAANTSATAAVPVAPAPAAAVAPATGTPTPAATPATPIVHKPVPVAPAPVVAESDDSWLMIIGAVAVVLLLAAYLLLARRRRQQQAEPELGFEDVNDAVVVRPERAVAVPVAAVAATVTPVAAPRSEPSISAAPPAPAPRRESGPATDALDGASIYIAYGRFNEALGILREGLGREPARTDLRVRMLEVLGQQGDTAGYAEQEAVLLEGGYSAQTLEQTRARYPKLAPVAPAAVPAAPSPVAVADIAAGVAAAAAAPLLAHEPEPEQQAIRTPPAATEASPAELPLANAADESFDPLFEDFPDLSSYDETPLPILDPVPAMPPAAPVDEFQLNLDDLSLDADWDMVSPFDTPARPKAAPTSIELPPEVDHEFTSNLKELPEVFEMPDEQFLSDFADPNLEIAIDIEPALEPTLVPSAMAADQDALDNAFLDSFIADADLPELDALTVDFDDLERQQASAEKLEQAQAFIDEGDFSQASDLLLDLLREGDDSCKHTARQLLSSIS